MAAKNILFVTHRYAPYHGGTENNVRNMAEEFYRRGHQVTVLAETHKGDFNNIAVTSDVNILFNAWDLVIIHGGYISYQKYILNQAKQIPSPTLFLMIEPETSADYQRYVNDCTYVGCGTIEDWECVRALNCENKAVWTNYGVNKADSVAKTHSFRDRFGINTELMVISSGGFSDHKRHQELINLFGGVGRLDMTLVVTGYEKRCHVIPQEAPNVRVILLEDRDDLLDAMSSADLYIMHSSHEGFGLVIIESMLNKTPWASRNMAGAKLLKEYGFTYDTDQQLLDYLKTFKRVDSDKLEQNYQYAIKNHLVQNTVDDILKLI